MTAIWSISRSNGKISTTAGSRLRTFETLHRAFPPEVVFPGQPLLLYETALKADNPVLAVKTALDSVCAVRSHINRIYGKADLRGVVRRCATP